METVEERIAEAQNEDSEKKPPASLGRQRQRQRRRTVEWPAAPEVSGGP